MRCGQGAGILPDASLKRATYEVKVWGVGELLKGGEKIARFHPPGFRLSFPPYFFERWFLEIIFFPRIKGGFFLGHIFFLEIIFRAGLGDTFFCHSKKVLWKFFFSPYQQQLIFCVPVS